ncbi:MAG: hypothetical protein ACOZAN_03005 [Patescibacteria group bacterium]
MFRWLVFLGSIHTGVSLTLPEALTLSYLGDEGILGTISSILSLGSAVFLYFLGKQEKAYKKRTQVLTFALIPLLVASALLLVSFGKNTILLFLVANGLFNTFFWYVYFPILSYQVDKNSLDDPASSYPYYFDHEIFINLGRILAVTGYIVLVLLIKEKAIPVAVAISTFSQLGMLIVVKKMHTKSVIKDSNEIGLAVKSEGLIS